MRVWVRLSQSLLVYQLVPEDKLAVLASTSGVQLQSQASLFPLLYVGLFPGFQGQGRKGKD